MMDRKDFNDIALAALINCGVTTNVKTALALHKSLANLMIAAYEKGRSDEADAIAQERAGASL